MSESELQHDPQRALQTEGSTPKEPDDFLPLLREGDADAFRQLMIALQPNLLRRARAIVAIAALAEDAVQETWLAAFRGIQRFEGRSSVKTWIISILEKRARTIAKRERRLVAILSEPSSTADPGDSRENPAHYRSMLGAQRLWTHASDSPEHGVLSAEQVGHIRRVISTLPAKQRNVLALRTFHGHSPQSVSAKLGISEGNQRVLLHRARQAVKTALQDFGQG